ncbi:MAG: tetratricopeptide repeat protein [Acidobacteriota bacterium]
MTNTLSAFLPQDRLNALARGETLPDRAQGSALFADISGFTPLTESLVREFGLRRGAEELTRRINAVYDTIIAPVERYNGSVITFAGDAITCWFNATGGNSSPRAVASALAMQAAMLTHSDLSLKVAVTTGPVRRFAVGDPQIQLIDTLAGATIARLAAAEHLAHGEVIVDAATVDASPAIFQIREWRTDAETQQRFAVIAAAQNLPSESTIVAPRDVPLGILRPWIVPTVLAREQSGLAEFLTELRPAVALFLRFAGIDYDGDDSARDKLDTFIRQAQHIVAQYDGTLLQLTIGDKGSYLYVAFGVPNAHEDDARRAVNAALSLREVPRALGFVQAVQIGISRGTLRVGASGSTTRRTYAALGDDVNLAARLMTMAMPGEILVSGHVQHLLGEQFLIEPRVPLPIKGKAEPLPVFALTGAQRRRAIRLQEPAYALPMVGRQTELELVNEKLDLSLQGKSQIIGIVAEAGMGKSRLVAEVIRSASRKGFAGYGGACESSGTNTPYLAWKSVWSAFFDIDPSAPLKKRLRHLEGEIQDRVPERVEAMPLLGILLNLEIPDNDFTKNLEPKYRQSALRALLEDCLRFESREEPLVIVIEDLHWIDALSHDLLEELARGLSDCRVCFVLAYRPPELHRLQAPRLEAMPNFTRIELHELSQGEAKQAIRAKLAQLYPARSGGVPSELVNKLMAHAQGNPFYLEELLNYLHDRGLDPLDPDDLKKIELPESLHTLILSRLDQLSEHEKTTLRVASVIGRLFRAAWLTGYYPELGDVPQIKTDLDQLANLDITPLDTPEPELAYLFKHMVTHEVTYESRSYATRTKLHGQLARYLENKDASVDTIAFHYGRSENNEKQREYFRKAGEAARKNFANDAALDYYGKLLPLLEGEREPFEIHLKRGQVLELMGKWNKTEADYRAALDSAGGDTLLKLGAQLALGNLNRLRGNYAPALDWLAQAKAARTALGDTEELAQVLIETGKVLYRKGDYAQANEILNKGLALARESGVKSTTAQALDTLANVVGAQGDDAAAWALYEESLALMREIGDKAGIPDSLNGLGILAMKQGDYAAARARYEESLALYREMGEQHGIMVLLHNLGYLSFYQGDHRAARARFEEILTPTKEMDDKTGVGFVLLGLGLAELAENNPKAREHILHSLRLRQETGEQVQQTSSLIGAAGLALREGNATRAAKLLSAVESALKALNAAVAEELVHFHLQTLAAVRVQLGEAVFQAAWDEGAQWSLEEAVKRELKDA